MGDRTHVSIQIRKIDYEWLLRAEFNDYPEQMRDVLYYEYLEFQDDLVDLEANEINYGEWDELEGLLYAHSIEYDKTWGAGGDYAGEPAITASSTARCRRYKSTRGVKTSFSS